MKLNSGSSDKLTKNYIKFSKLVYNEVYNFIFICDLIIAIISAGEFFSWGPLSILDCC